MNQAHPPVVIEKAQRIEELLERVEQGEELASVRAELELEVSAEQQEKWQAKYEGGDRKWEALLDGRYGHQQKLSGEMKEWLYEQKREDERLTGAELAEKLAERFGVKVSVGHLNHVLRQVGLSRQTGRPPKRSKEEEKEEKETTGQAVDNAGLFFPGRSKRGDGGSRGSARECGNGPSGVSRGQPRGLVAAAEQFAGNDLE